MSAGESFALPTSEPQPSQCYPNGRKLSLATRWFDSDDPEYDPIPVRRLDGEWALLDGHTRVFLAAMAGAEELVVVENREILPVDRNRRCVSWCRGEGVTGISEPVRPGAERRDVRRALGGAV